jgi:hypothetical protein
MVLQGRLDCCEYRFALDNNKQQMKAFLLIQDKRMFKPSKDGIKVVDFITNGVSVSWISVVDDG